jgi:hypothetical protein
MAEAGLWLNGIRTTLAAELAAEGHDLRMSQVVMGHQTPAAIRTIVEAFAKERDLDVIRRVLHRRGRLKPEDVSG